MKVPPVLSMLLVLTSILGIGCGVEKTEQEIQDEKKMENVDRLMSNRPEPALMYSMDRYLLAQRGTRFNDPNKMMYLYVCMIDGTWFKYTIVGKVASASKRLTSPTKAQIIWSRQTENTIAGYELGPAADFMGTYGESSGNAKVGMTTLGTLLEFGGMMSYMYSETPLMFERFKKDIIEVTVQATPEERESFLKTLDEMKQQMQRLQMQMSSQ